MNKVSNINKLFFIFLIFSVSIFSVEIGGSQTGYFSAHLDSANTSRVGRIYAPRPHYVWRNPFEEIVVANVFRNYGIYATKEPLGGNTNPLFRNHTVQVTIGSNHADVVPTFSNPSSTSGFTTNVETRNDDKSVHWTLDFTSGSSSWQILASDINVTIPWSVPDGVYNMTYTRDFHTTNAGTVSTNPNWIGGYTLKTYLNIYVDDIDFGKVIFSPGANDITKSSTIDIAGAINANVQITAPTTVNLQSPHNDYNIPIQVTLNDNGVKGNQITATIDNDGRYSLDLEVTLMPGKYSDYGIYEGRYTGDVALEFVYN